MSKGSNPRPINKERFDSNIERMFGPRAPQRCWNCSGVTFRYKDGEWKCRTCGEGAQG